MRIKEDILACSAAELNYGLAQFVREITRPNGERYEPDSIYYLCLGIQQVRLAHHLTCHHSQHISVAGKVPPELILSYSLFLILCATLSGQPFISSSRQDNLCRYSSRIKAVCQDPWPRSSLHCTLSGAPFLKKMYLFIFRHRRREGEREGEKHQCVAACRASPGGHPAHNPGMCPDWESNQQPVGLQAGAQSTEPHQPGLWVSFVILKPVLDRDGWVELGSLGGGATCSSHWERSAMHCYLTRALGLWRTSCDTSPPSLLLFQRGLGTAHLQAYLGGSTLGHALKQLFLTISELPRSPCPGPLTLLSFPAPPLGPRV